MRRGRGPLGGVRGSLPGPWRGGLGSLGHLHFARDLNPWATGGKADVGQLRGWRTRICAGGTGPGGNGAAELAAGSGHSGRLLLAASNFRSGWCRQCPYCWSELRGHNSLWPLPGGRALGGMGRGLRSPPGVSSGRPPPGQVWRRVVRLWTGM